MKHWSIDVQGRVQGVFFRASTREIADELQVKGYVENRPDGSVHIEAEGTENNLKTFLDWCHKGPSNARVTAVDYRENAIKGFEDFQIRR